MTPSEIRRSLERLGINDSQTVAGRALGMTDRQLRRLLTGVRDIQPDTEALLAVLTGEKTLATVLAEMKTALQSRIEAARQIIADHQAAKN